MLTSPPTKYKKFYNTSNVLPPATKSLTNNIARFVSWRELNNARPNGQNTLVKITASIDEIKLQILEKKFERGDNEETITDWSKSIENEVEEVDGEVEKLQRYLDTRKAEDASKTKETERVQQLQFEKEQYEQKLRFEER